MAGICSAFRAIEDATMVQRLLLAGMLSGLVVALLAFGFARMYSEPTIERAIQLEEQAHGHDEHADDGTVSRSMQRNAGLLTGIATYCVALGGFLALGLAFLHGRLAAGSRSTVWMLVSAGYVSLVLIPQLKYPANPPGVGVAETIGSRTELYFVLVLASLSCMIFSAWIVFRLRQRLPASIAFLVGALVFAAMAGFLMSILPRVSEVPHDFPRGLLFELRVHAALLQLIVWGGLGLLFGKVSGLVIKGDRQEAYRYAGILAAAAGMPSAHAALEP
jgi:hypothetical protein